eukprot:Amastigsp_a841570_145.p2 type:complete len:235 gc:universal Amastigsp_a841570_145:717-13(-)
MGAGACVGILTSQGIVLGSEKKVSSKLLEPSKRPEKTFKIDSHILVAVAGMTSDANSLIEMAQQNAQRYRHAYDAPMPVEQLVRRISDIKQAYTQYGGLRPYGVSVLYAGIDDIHGFQLYVSDPSGNYGGWKATAIGANSANAQSLLKQKYDDDMTVDQGLALAVAALSKAMDSTSLDGAKIELVVLSQGPDGEPELRQQSAAEIDALVATLQAEREAEAKAQAEKEAAEARRK